MASPVSRFMRKDAPENRAYSIRCRECGEKEQLLPSNPSGTLPPEMVSKKFTQRGWRVGSTPRKDLCPDCQKRPKVECEEVRVAKVDKNLRAEIIDLHPKKEEPVKTLDRETRRIILAKLNEVYGDERSGYHQGWSDERVARDLGIQGSWVTDLRYENFGDLPVSAIDKGFLDEAHKVLEEIKAVHAEADALRVRSRNMLSEAERITRDLADLDRKMDDLLAQEQLLAEQIAKVA